jgi:putative pyruvate formate lyase activating enzyme
MRQFWATPDRLERARQHYSRCFLCEHRCAANRLSGQRGPCKAGETVRIFRHRVEYSEESELVPSHLFYVSGCDLRCVFCIAELNAFDPRRGQAMTPEQFHQLVALGRAEGARTLEWVGGEPTIHLPGILDLMADCPDLPPVIWKSDFYCTPESMELLDGVVDFYVADFKFGNDACAKRLAKVGNYVAVVTRNLLRAAKQGELIVRHLLLPNHFDCCYRPVVHWMQHHMPCAKFSLRDGYLPSWQSGRYQDVAEPLSRAQGRAARELALAAGLRLVY